jgi:CHAT domain-containing protein/tetratricopeptide (TPR) repeat protein
MLTTGSGFTCPLAGGESRIYRLSLSADQFADIRLAEKNIQVTVRVMQPGAISGAVPVPLADYDADSKANGVEHLSLVAESAGLYEMEVRAKYAHESAGTFAIDLESVRPATHADHLLFQARTFSTQAKIQSDNGHYGQAVALSQKALPLGQEAVGANDAYVGELSQRLGSLEFLAGDREKAGADLERAIRIDRGMLDPNNPQLASALLGMGYVYIAANVYAKAQEVLEQGVQISTANQGPESPEVADCLAALALLHQHRGDYPRALTEIKHALAIDQEKRETDDRATLEAMDGLGDLYFEMEDREHAMPVLQQTLNLMERKLGPDHPFIAHPLQNLGILARDQKQFPLALEYLWRAENIREQTLGSQHASTASLLVNIGNVYAQEGDYQRSTEAYLRALSVMEKAAGPYHQWTIMTLGNLARVYAAQNDTSDAVAYQARMDAAAETNLSLNLAVGSEHERLVYADRFVHHIDRTVSLNLTEAPGDPAAADLAAQIILQRKGRVLDAVADSMSALRRRLDPEDQKLLNQLSDTLAALAKSALHGPGQASPAVYEATLKKLEQQKEKLETEISRRSAGFFQKTDPVTLAAVRSAIPSDSVLIEFAVYRTYDFRRFQSDQEDSPLHYVAYVIPPQGDLRWKDLGDAKEIDHQVETYRQALRDPKRADVGQLSRALDARIMEPLRAFSLGGKHLILSPDGELNLLSFESMLDEQGRYMVEDFPISYVTTGRDLLRMQVARTGRSDPVVVANPLFGDPDEAPARETAPASLKRANAVSIRRSVTTGAQNELYFAPLTGTSLEAAELKSLLPEARVLTGSQATKAEIEQLQSPEILHIATHGFFLASHPEEGQGSANTRSAAQPPEPDPENPLLRSGLALAGANLGRKGRADGILTALEASSLNLWGTKLVTLSACDTGVGEIRNGEGVYGLRRAFFIAGAETVVMSLWPVSDSVTRELMASYYRGLKSGMGRGEALRQAQLAMLGRKGREHPFYWGSFIQVGEWANLDGKR